MRTRLIMLSAVAVLAVAAPAAAAEDIAVSVTVGAARGPLAKTGLQTVPLLILAAGALALAATLLVALLRGERTRTR